MKQEKKHRIAMPSVVRLLPFVLVFSLLTLGNCKKSEYKYSTKKSLNDTLLAKDSIIIDSDITLEKALSGIEIPPNIKPYLSIIKVNYYGFDGKLHVGQLVVNKFFASDISAIFDAICKSKFPVHSVIPISEFNWSDEESMKANNTTCFNYRKIAGSNTLSYHSYGRAIDINPMQNPFVSNKGITPVGASYNPEQSGTLTKKSAPVIEFIRRGWEWGGNWPTVDKDYQHFTKW